MATVDLTVLPCGEHIRVDITIGGETYTVITTKTELMDASVPHQTQDIILHNLKVFCRLSGGNDWSAIKAALNTKEFKI